LVRIVKVYLPVAQTCFHSERSLQHGEPFDWSKGEEKQIAFWRQSDLEEPWALPGEPMTEQEIQILPVG
jgi:hypothetical protein